MFVNLIITTQRIKAITKRFKADIPEEKRNGNDVSSSIYFTKPRSLLNDYIKDGLRRLNGYQRLACVYRPSS